METAIIDFTKSAGKMKPMHSVNNGPVYKFAIDQRVSNLEAYKAAGIPYARNHDAAFFNTYGGEHSVDISAIFPDFDKDEYDENSYDFQLTDEYLKTIELAGTKVFYRLGSKIEHNSKKYGTLPPKDFKKWAVICEHIIRHYNEGWAGGLHMGIEYWEIWNEPDLDEDDSAHKRCWGGTKLQYFELYNIAAKHLKSCFPDIKVGGPALAFRKDWAEDFLKQLTAPLDFFSWHCYSATTEHIQEDLLFYRRLLDENGYQSTESILNEWNYAKGWTGDAWVYTLKSEKSIKGAAFTAAVMCDCQYAPLDNLMYYDARPCAMNGLFNTDYVSETLKGYYPFKMFNTLYHLGEASRVLSDCPEIHLCAARSENKGAAMLAYFSDDDMLPEKEVKLTFKTDFAHKGLRLVFRLLDAAHDDEIVKEELISSDEFSVYVKMPLFGVYMIEMADI